MIYLAPVNHFDPIGRAGLIRRLESLRIDLQAPPGFVAVEYDPEQLQQYVQQRPRFRDMLAREWPDLSKEELDMLAGSLAYDGDAHRSVFSEAATIWLDRGRHFSPEQLHGYAEGRLRIYRIHAAGNLAGRLPQLSQRIRDIAKPPEGGNERDQRFADSLLSALSGGISGVVIVGANHANESVSGTMAFILRDRDVTIHRI